MTTIAATYKGNDYIVTMRGNDFAYAQDTNGYNVTDLKTIQALTMSLSCYLQMFLSLNN